MQNIWHTPHRNAGDSWEIYYTDSRLTAISQRRWPAGSPYSQRTCQKPFAQFPGIEVLPTFSPYRSRTVYMDISNPAILVTIDTPLNVTVAVTDHNFHMRNGCFSARSQGRIIRKIPFLWLFSVFTKWSATKKRLQNRTIPYMNLKFNFRTVPQFLWETAQKNDSLIFRHKQKNVCSKLQARHTHPSRCRTGQNRAPWKTRQSVLHGWFYAEEYRKAQRPFNTQTRIRFKENRSLFFPVAHSVPSATSVKRKFLQNVLPFEHHCQTVSEQSAWTPTQTMTKTTYTLPGIHTHKCSDENLFYAYFLYI